jgi:BlaR1 peptidase M56
MTSVLFSYLVKVSISLAIQYLFYYLALRKMTCYNWNRGYLLLYALFSFFFPFVHVSVWPQRIDAVHFVNQLPSLPSYPYGEINTTALPAYSYPNILFLLYLTGVIALSLRLLIQFVSLYRLRSRSVLLTNYPVKIYHLNENILPFSFHKSIYINQQQHPEAMLQEVLNHELVHIRQRHSIDVLIAEFMCILNWFNPFAWLIRRAIKENLEFIADAQVVEHGVSRKQYQYHLLQALGYAPSALVSPFNFSSMKKRIMMMNKTRTGKIHLLKFFLVIPVILFSLFAFRSTHDHKKAGLGDSNNTAVAGEGFRLHELTYYIKNQNVAILVKSTQEKSLLRPGEWLSLSLLQNESNRLKKLLQDHGYAPITDHTVSFLIDSSLTNKSFSIRVVIDVSEKAGSIKSSDRTDQEVYSNIPEGRQARGSAWIMEPVSDPHHHHFNGRDIGKDENPRQETKMEKQLAAAGK